MAAQDGLGSVLKGDVTSPQNQRWPGILQEVQEKLAAQEGDVDKLEGAVEAAEADSAGARAALEAATSAAGAEARCRRAPCRDRPCRVVRLPCRLLGCCRLAAASPDSRCRHVVESLCSGGVLQIWRILVAGGV